MKKLFFQLNQNKLLFISYAAIMAWFGLTVILAKTVDLTPWSIIVIFAGLLVTPGFGLARIFKIHFASDRLGQIILWFTMGLIFSLLLCLVSILAGLSIITLNNFYLWILGATLVLALALDLIRKQPDEQPLTFNWKNIFKTENLVYLLLIVLGLGGVLIVAVQEALFRGGDPSFHLSILRKAYEGFSLTAGNLGFTKSEKIHIAYGTPIWHIFLALLARLNQVDIFIVWKAVAGALSFVALFVWYWLFDKILKNRFLSILSTIFFLLFIFNQSVGYFFTCLPLPDTLATYLLLPLAIALAIKYIFDKSVNYKLLITIVILVILMAIIHLTQYFYFLLIVGMTGVVWLIVQRKSGNYVSVLKKIGWILIATALVFIPFMVILELKGHIISKILKSAMAAPPADLRYGLFKKWNTFAKYAYLLTPLVFVFLKKNPRLTFLFALMLISPIAYYDPISLAVMKFMDYIFLDRLIGSITWHFIVLGLIYGFLILILEKAISAISSKIWKIAANLAVVLATVTFIWAQIKFQTASKIFELIFSKTTDKYLISHLFWILAIIILISLIILLLQIRIKKFADFFTLEEPKNWLIILGGIVFLLTIFFSTTYQNLWSFVSFGLKKDFVLEKVTFVNLKSGDSHWLIASAESGGEDLIDFVKKNVPPKSVFMVPGTTVYIFPELVDQYMAAYARTEAFSDYSRIYEFEYDLKEKLRQLSKGKIEYIILNRPEPQGKAFFEQYPQYFKKIFESQSVIFQVLPQAEIDYQSGKITP